MLWQSFSKIIILFTKIFSYTLLVAVFVLAFIYFTNIFGSWDIVKSAFQASPESVLSSKDVLIKVRE